MLGFLYGQDEIVAKFVATLIPHCQRGFGNCKTIGVLDREGRLIGGIVYHHYDPDAGVIEMSGAATDPHWLTRETLARMYGYPFDECGCQMVVMRVAADNERLLRQLAAYNYSFITIPRLFGRDRDAVLCLLTHEDWIENRFNKGLKAARTLAHADRNPLIETREAA